MSFMACIAADEAKGIRDSSRLRAVCSIPVAAGMLPEELLARVAPEGLVASARLCACAEDAFAALEGIASASPLAAWGNGVSSMLTTSVISYMRCRPVTS